MPKSEILDFLHTKTRAFSQLFCFSSAKTIVSLSLVTVLTLFSAATASGDFTILTNGAGAAPEQLLPKCTDAEPTIRVCPTLIVLRWIASDLLAPGHRVLTSPGRKGFRSSLWRLVAPVLFAYTGGEHPDDRDATSRRAHTYRRNLRYNHAICLDGSGVACDSCSEGRANRCHHVCTFRVPCPKIEWTIPDMF